MGDRVTGVAANVMREPLSSVVISVSGTGRLENLPIDDFRENVGRSGLKGAALVAESNVTLWPISFSLEMLDCGTDLLDPLDTCRQWAVRIGGADVWAMCSTFPSFETSVEFGGVGSTLGRTDAL